MGKKSLIGLVSLLGIAGVGLASCGGSGSDPKTLNVICLNKGYGDAWIKEVVTQWEADNPGYKVNLDANSNATTKINKNIHSSKNTDDLYISVGTDWRSYSAQGLFASLDDLIEEEVDGVKVKDKLFPEYRNSIYRQNKSGETHAYRLPWTSGVGGIYYNTKLFEENNLSVPTTYAELLTLIGQINALEIPYGDTEFVKPFVYTGANTDYFDYAVFTWWGQLAGKENIDEFLKYSDAKNFDTTDATFGATYNHLKTAVNMWNDIFSDTNNSVTGSIALSNHDAQQEFLKGHAAMMFNSDWLYNEILSYCEGSLPSNFGLGLMKTPSATGAVDTNISYIVGEDQYIAIPASSTKQDLAKSFIKALVSNKGCKAFTENAHGMLAYNWDYESYSSSDSYVNSLLDYRKSMTSTFTNFSSSTLYLNGKIDIWVTGAARPFQGLLKGSYQTVNQAFDVIKEKAKQVFES